MAHTRLAWWDEECERLAAGEPRHPLTQALGRQLPAALLAGVRGLTGPAIWDLAKATFETRRELSAYCERWAGAMIEPIASLAVQTEAGPRWRALGAALREIELLTQLPGEARQGRLRLPLEELARTGTEPEAFIAATCPAEAASLLKTRHEALRRTLEAGVLGVAPLHQPPLRGLLVWVQLAWRQSLQAERTLPAWLPPQGSGRLGQSWEAWRAARAAQRGGFRLQ